MPVARIASVDLEQPLSRDQIGTRETIDARLRWLASRTIHDADHMPDSGDGLKVDRHQANCVSISTIDGSRGALSWIGGVRGNRVSPPGIERFGQAGDSPDLYREYRLDTRAILDAAAELLL